MLSAAMVCVLPFRVDDRSLANFNYAVTRHQTYFTGGNDKFDVRPLIAMMVNVVGDLAQQNAFGLQHAESLFHERWEGVCERVLVFLG